ncbi:MAG: ATP-binding protein [Oscillospiraceae bacterium]|nr:ATP-binding protein [Oscillospiraceae bacterium]
MNMEIKKQLTMLELGDLASVIENQEKDVSLSELNYNERLESLLNELITERQNRLIARLIKNADLKYPNAGIDTLDCDARGITKDMIINLTSMGFVSAATNLIITGATGAGKTYLSCVIGAEACRQSLRTCYIRMPDMLGHFGYHKDNLREQVRYRKRLSNYKVLIIDEWLNYKINERESKFIYELIEARCGNNPTIFVSQYGTEDWHDRLGGGTQADSIMDRIIHNSYKIPTTDNNLRKLYDSKKAKAVIDSLS